MVSGYGDLVVMRHPEESAVHEFAAATNVPVVNAGNGPGEQPTQALLDMFTLHREFARTGRTLDGSRIPLVGDLRHGRTVHSLIKLVTRYEDLTVVCATPGPLGLPAELLELAERRGHRIELSDHPETGLKDADPVYATRLQTERFADRPLPYSDEFRVDRALVSRACREDAVIMHPLPRDSRPGSNDLATDLNRDPGWRSSGRPTRASRCGWRCSPPSSASPTRSPARSAPPPGTAPSSPARTTPRSTGTPPPDGLRRPLTACWQPARRRPVVRSRRPPPSRAAAGGRPGWAPRRRRAA